MPGNHENIVKLNADHSGVCKFGPSLEDQDNFKLVRGNMKDLYKNALETSELSVLPSVMGVEGRSHAVDDGNMLQARLIKLKGDRI